MVTITKANARSKIWQNFYDALDGNISVTLADSTTHTIQKYTSSFPDVEQTTKSSFPILVVESPNVSWTNFTFTKNWIEGSILIEVYATKSEAAEKLLDDVINTIETSRDTFAALKLRQLNLDSTDQDSFMRGNIKIHMQSATFTFKWYFDKTKVY